MNIIYIHSHDTGRYISPYGYPVPTPAIERFARESVVFRQAFCANPTCSASRAALLTGQWPHTNGMLGLAHRGWKLNDYDRHLAHTLNEAGFATALCGVQHVLSHQGADGGKLEIAEKLGYERCLDAEPGTEGKTLGMIAADYVRSKPGGPFFLSFGHHQTHRKFREAGPEDDPGYIRPPAIFPDTPETRRDMAEFCATAREWDGEVKLVLDAVYEAGLRDDTLIILTTDHGIAFPFMKCNLTDHGIGVLLIMRGPGGFTGGKIIDAMVSHVDVYPTLCEYLGIDPPTDLQGVSFLPVIQEEAESVREAVFAEVNYHASFEPMRAVRTERYKYIRRYDPREKPVLPNIDAGYTKTYLLKQGLTEQPRSDEMLFDLVFDPMEVNNLADRPGHEEIIVEMRGRLERWMRETDDPLLEAPLDSTPEGKRLDDPDALNPGG